jgi:hypothetical protein
VPPKIFKKEEEKRKTKGLTLSQKLLCMAV